MSIMLSQPLEWKKEIIQSCLGDWFGKAKAYIEGGPCYAFANTMHYNTRELAEKALDESIREVEGSL